MNVFASAMLKKGLVTEEQVKAGQPPLLRGLRK